MKRYITYLFLAFYTLGLSAQTDSRALSPNELWNNSLRLRLDSIVRKAEKQRYTLGLSVYDLTADAPLYQYQARQMMKPASTQKLFVGLAALTYLGTDYNFQTHAYVDGNIRTDHTGRRYLAGDIIIRGGFDPTLQLDDYNLLTEKIRGLQLDSIDGRIIVDNRSRLDVRNARNAQLQIAQHIHSNLLSTGIRFSTDNAYADSAEPLTRGWNLATISTPISKVMPRMMKKSDNRWAECMLLNLADMGRYSDWSYDRCKQRVIDMMKSSEWNKKLLGEDERNLTFDGEYNDEFSPDGKADEYIIIDGSGLSHDNRTSARLLTSLLRYAYANEDYYRMLYESLPIAGVDGTLDTRMKSGPAYRNVRAKTGTLNGVSTLAGYVTASNGHILCFSILVNNLGGLGPGKSLQNDICTELAK